MNLIDILENININRYCVIYNERTLKNTTESLDCIYCNTFHSTEF